MRANKLFVTDMLQHKAAARHMLHPGQRRRYTPLLIVIKRRFL